MTNNLISTTDDGAKAGPPHLLYLYGIVMPDSAAAGLLRERHVAGIEPDTSLFPIEAAGLVAAVSEVPASVFDEASLNTLTADLEMLTPYVIRHEDAIRALLGSAVIPMTFGAIYRTPQSVAALLERRAREFRTLLDRFHGRQEWGVKVFTDNARLLQIVEQEDATLRALDAEAASASAGRAYLIARKRDRLLAAAAAQHAAESVRDILERLAALSVTVAQDQPGPAQPGAEQLACKAAFLIDESALTTFHDAVIDLERRFSPRGLRLEVSGPWAPYSFVRPGDTSNV